MIRILIGVVAAIAVVAIVLAMFPAIRRRTGRAQSVPAPQRPPNRTGRTGGA